MTTTTDLDEGTVTAEDLATILRDVWDSYVEPDVLDEVSATADGDLGAEVAVTGSWEGHIAVTCSRALAEQLTARFLGAESEGLEDEEVYDSLGELVNIVGGAVKSMMPGPSALSLPWVFHGATPHRPGQRRSAEISMSWDGEVIGVAVWVPSPRSTTDHEQKDPS